MSPRNFELLCRDLLQKPLVLTYVALADGHLDERESQILREAYSRAGFTPDDIREVNRVIQECSPRMVADWTENAKPLGEFFGTTTLRNITPERGARRGGRYERPRGSITCASTTDATRRSRAWPRRGNRIG